MAKTKNKAEAKYNTNLASEFFMMSILHRKGIQAYLSLSNKKGVDIIVETKNKKICYIEVKGVRERDPWRISSNGIFPAASNLFYALVCFDQKNKEISEQPDFYLIPSKFLESRAIPRVDKYNKSVYLLRSQIEFYCGKFLNNIDCLKSICANIELSCPSTNKIL